MNYSTLASKIERDAEAARRNPRSHIACVDTCEVVAEQLVRDVEAARVACEAVDPFYGYNVRQSKADAVRLKNNIVELAGAARRGKRV